MAITYEVAEIGPEGPVEVTYTNEAGHTHKRQVNVPRDENGEVLQELFDEILEGQLRGVQNKLLVGAVSFTDPTSEPEGVEESAEV